MQGQRRATDPDRPLDGRAGGASGGGARECSGLILLAPSPPWGVPGASMEEAISAVSLYALGPFWMQAIDPDYALAKLYSLDRMEKADRKAVFSRMVPESGLALWQTLNWWLDPFMTTSIPSGRVDAPALVDRRGPRRDPPAGHGEADR